MKNLNVLYSLSKIFWVWLSSKTQGQTQDPTQNPEFKIFEPKPSPYPEVLGLGRQTQKKQARCRSLVLDRVNGDVARLASALVTCSLIERFRVRAPESSDTFQRPRLDRLTSPPSIVSTLFWPSKK